MSKESKGNYNLGQNSWDFEDLKTWDVEDLITFSKFQSLPKTALSARDLGIFLQQRVLHGHLSSTMED